MTVFLLEPHHDDAVLFACYTLLALKPTVITVLGSDTAQDGIDAETRQWESKMAMAHLQVPYAYWPVSERKPNWDLVASAMSKLRDDHAPDAVWVPLAEDGGHEQHNLVAREAGNAFGVSRLRFYATYRRGSARTRTEHEVAPQPDWPAAKFKAMSCYISQINLDNCRPWFSASDMLREWIA